VVNRHVEPAEPGSGPPAPEPTFAERARTLVHLGRTGTLSTLSRRHPGHPFGSIMPYALDAGGRPLFLISSLAMHTQNLAADPRASLLVTEPGAVGDPLAAGRVTLMGEVLPVPEAERAAARGAYLAAHATAAYWVDFQDFAFHRLEVLDVYYVGGFAAMDWISPAAYLAARPDPLADAAGSIMEHMNRDHGDALVTFARVLARSEADEASMVSVDRLGFKLRIRSADRLHSARIPFPREVRTAEDSRVVLIEMLRQARAAAGSAAPPGRGTPAAGSPHA
jgi:putative heme iron utilization protein